MNTLFWALQALVAVTFFYSGINKSIYSEQHLVSKGQTGVEGYSTPSIRFIGIIEILGAIGLLLPGIVKILPVAVPIAAIGFSIIMVLAARIHYQRKEPPNVAINLILLLLCICIAIYRF